MYLKYNSYIALILRSYFKTQRVSIPLFSSFEALCVRLTIASSSYLLLTIYRPPSSNMSLFISEFSALLEDIISSLSELIITGDFNIHVDDVTSHCATAFLSILDSFGLSQLVDFPTHISGHTIDLVITRSSSTFFTEVDYTDPSLSDNSVVLSSFSVPSHSRYLRITKHICNIKSIDKNLFSHYLLSCSLYTHPVTTLNLYLLQFSSTVTKLLDKYAPLKTISCPFKIREPFINR